MDLRPSDNFTDRFFVNYFKGKCTRQVIGKNKIGDVPKTIATFLNLENPKTYTGHCLRRTAATLLSDSGASLQSLKQLGGWRSDKVALGYVENSMHARQNIYNGIVQASTSAPPRNPQPSTSTANITLPPVEQTSEPTDVISAAASTSGVIAEEISIKDLVIDWGDFSEDFSITPEHRATTSEFATAAGKSVVISDAKLLEVKDLELDTASMISGSKGHCDVPLGSNIRPAASVASKHFTVKEAVKLNFNELEPAEKKRKIDCGKEKPKAEPLVFNKKNVDVPYGAKFEHCVFNNCTINFLPNTS